jgi:2-polyprenyl-3-methyl-5-hydroxy-6-metoxy-1,4-benzoquinol methylase
MNYGWGTKKTPVTFDYIAPIVLKIIEENFSQSVIDLGSGNGALCGFLNNKGIDIIGVEQDVVGTEIARVNFPNVQFINSSIDEASKILDEHPRFDAVVSTEVIEHLYDPSSIPRLSSLILKKDGLLIISTPYHGYLKNLALSIFNHWDIHHTPLWRGGHIKFFSIKTLTKLLEDNNFEVIKFYGLGRFYYLWKTMILVARKNH